MNEGSRFIADLLERVELDSFKASIDPAFGSQNEDHRPRVREALRLAVEKATGDSPPPGFDSLTDLKRRPRVDGWAMSVSHCPGLGGYILGPSKLSVGFDLEETQRVTSPIVERVLPFELEKSWYAKSSFPSTTTWAAMIWAAKEASIKAFGNLTRSDLNFTLVELTSFTAEGRFTARHRHHHAQGLAQSFGAHTAAIAKTRIE